MQAQAPTEMNSIEAALRLVQRQVESAVQKSLKTKRATLVGVSKTKPVEALQEAYDAGLRHFGENYVEEIVLKQPKLPADIQWHFIGHLQSNKLKDVMVPNLYVLETVDTDKLATKLDAFCKKNNRQLKVFVQIKTSDEDTKYGVDPKDSFELVQHIIENCTSLQFSGLMTIGKSGDLTAFSTLYELRKQISEKFKLAEQDLELSMGMSADFEQAIAEGATNVRVGSTIFGARDYTK